jgi:hypothetical protein
VAAASYLTRGEARKRFKKSSNDEYQQAEYRVDKDTQEVGGADNRERAKFWEIWSKGDRRVLWVAKGCEKILDEDDPHLDLRGFFPCPKPAYGTVQRGSLVPVPDVLQYKDQLEEVNLLTARIHALSDALEVKGFYPAGGAEIADAVQTAINIKTPGRVMVPIANWAAFGGSKEIIIWLPIENIAATIKECVALRKEIIQDIYQIMGLSDIMRGSSDPNETLGAQQMKSQYGSTRIRDKQSELVRLARDLVEITTEIVTEKFSPVTMIEMSQTQLPTQDMQKKMVAQIQQKAQQAIMLAQQAAPPPGQQPPQPGQQDPQQQVQQMIAQAEDAIKKVLGKPTIEQVLRFLKDNRMKSFVLDIETDSTIIPNEQAEKQQRSEFVGVLAQLLPQLSAMMVAEPKSAEFCGELLKFAVAPFRAGRSLDGAVDELVEQMKAKGDQPKPDDPATAQNKTALQIEQMKDTREKDKMKADAAVEAAKLKQSDDHKKLELATQTNIERMKLGAKQGDAEGKMQVANQKMQHEREEHQLDAVEREDERRTNQQLADIKLQDASIKQSDMIQRQEDRRAQQQFKMTQQGPLP